MLQDRNAPPDRRRAEWTGPRERRAAARLAPLRHDATHVEALNLRAADVHRHEWAALARRAIEPNPFFEPAFMLPMLHGLPLARQPVTLVARRRVAGAMRMVGLLPIARAQARFALGPVRAWSHPFAPMGAPLLDHDHAQEALGALLAYASANSGVAGGLALGAIDCEGPVAGLLARLTGGSHMRVRPLNPRMRPSLLAGSDGLGAGADREGLVFVLNEGERVLDALERYFKLEAHARRDPAFAALARAYGFTLAREGRCVIGELTRHNEGAGAPVASAIAVMSGARAVIWAAAGESGGAATSLALAEALLRREGVARVDGCAAMIGTGEPPLWPDRVAICDLLVPGGGAFAPHPFAPWASRSMKERR